MRTSGPQPTRRIRPAGAGPAVAVLLLLGLALGTCAQVLKTTHTLLALPVWLNLAAVVGLALAFARVPPRASGRARFLQPHPSSLLGWALAGLGGAGAVGCSLWLWRDWNAALLSVFAAGPLSLLLLAVGLDRLWGYHGALLSPPGFTRREAVALCGLTVVACLLCVWRFGYFPPPDGFASIEEAQRATGARWILERGARPWEWPLSQYSIAASFALFGRTMTAVRLPAIALGCATLVPFYFFVREMVAAPAALSATALLAVARWHVQVSWYNEDVYVPLCPFVLVLFVLVHTRREPRPSLYVLAAACCGYTLYDYAAFRITPAIALGFFAAEWLRPQRVRDYSRVAVFAGVLLLFALPLAGLLQANGGVGAYTEALQRSLANKGYYTTDWPSFVDQRWTRITQSIDMFTLSDYEGFLASLNTRGEPLLDPFTGVLFVLGFGTTALSPRRRFHAFTILTFLTLMLGTTVVVQNLDFRRLSILLPLVFALVALVVDQIDCAAAQLGGQRLLHALLLGVVAGAGAYNFHFLFDVLAPNHEVRAAHRDEYTTALFFLRRHHAGEYVVYLSPYVANLFLPNDYDWLKTADLQGRVVLGAEAAVPFGGPVPAGRDVLLVIPRPYDIDSVMAKVRAVYPGAACKAYPDPDDRKWDLGACRITAASVPAGIEPPAVAPPG